VYACYSRHKGQRVYTLGSMSLFNASSAPPVNGSGDYPEDAARTSHVIDAILADHVAAR
jgi:hypothetical protein